MEKNPVLIDTNLYLDDANIIFKLYDGKNKILIPKVVLKELDTKKYDRNLSYSARKAIQTILEFSAKHEDALMFDTNTYGNSVPDDEILAVARQHNATVATKDICMSVTAKSLGLRAILYDTVMNNIFQPYVEIHMNDFSSEFEFNYSNKYEGEDYFKILNRFSKCLSNELDTEAWWFLFIDNDTENKIVYANNPFDYCLERIDNNPKYREIKEDFKFKTKDLYQVCGLYALTNAPHVLIMGQWGTGKSLLSSAYALANNERKTFITRAPVGINSKYDIGFLPGPQPLDAKVLTPTGWTTMGNIKQGDYVIGKNGKKAKVLDVFYKGEKDIYKIETTNGGVTHACGDHIWATKNNNELKHNYDFKLRSTLEIKDSLINPNKGPKYNHNLPMNGVVKFERNEDLPIPPYTLGVLLGDGSFSSSISFSNIDNDLIARVEKEVGLLGMYLTQHGINYTISGKYTSNKPPKPVKITDLETGKVVVYETISIAAKRLNINKGALSWRCTKKLTFKNKEYSFLKPNHWQNPIKNAIYNLGLEGTKAYTKFIPEIYKYTSVENRLSLLQGLMDSDGTIKEITGEQILTTTSKKLATDVIEIARSLGINATMYRRDRRGKTSKIKERILTTKVISYEVTLPKSSEFNVFYIKRKASRKKDVHKKTHIKIKNVSYAGRKQVKCIKIDTKDHLYITDDFIITHNTTEDKLINWLQGFTSSLYYLYSNTKNDQDHNGNFYDYVKDRIFNEKFEIMPMNSIQGLSLLKGDMLIVDETQLITVDYLSMLLSRPSEGGKLILLGDIKQTYDVVKPAESGLLKLLRVLPHKYLAYIELKNSYRSPLIEVANKLQDKSII